MINARGAGRNSMYSANALKLGIFGSNCSSGLAATTLPDRWSGSWTDNLRLAQMLDDAGIEFILPVGRWKGYGGETNFEGSSFETVTWACGLLAATKHISVFGTVHVPLVHPVFAAKQFVTADHIGEGRFGLNIVVGWNEGEFEMFGVEQRAHDDRYLYGQEWIDVVKQLWSASEPFDYNGHYFTLKALEAQPKPFGGTRPIIMNAGLSAIGASYAIRNCDFQFISLRDMDHAAARVAEIRELAAREGDGNVGVYTSCIIVCRPTQREADDYYRYYADEKADWAAVDNLVANSTRGGSAARVQQFQQMRVRFAAGYGGWPIVGDPDHVAAELARISATGIAGVCASLPVNYLDEFPYIRAEVLPRLQRLGLREQE